MKPCVCGGSNSNCRFCSGSGYVPESIGLPQVRSGREKRGAASVVATEPCFEEKAPIRKEPKSTFFREMWWGLILPLIVIFFIYFLLSLFR
jgi:hypothetical protein